MIENQSRRAFLSGALVCGAVSAGGLYLAPGGRPAKEQPPKRSPDDLTLFTGSDPTGARELLIKMWNARNPDAQVSQSLILSGSNAERLEMKDRAWAGQADLLNLDVVDIPEFAAEGLLTRIRLTDAGEFLAPTLLASRVADDDGAYWAVPFNTDVGMLFHRTDVDDELPDLRTTIEKIKNNSRQFVGQLQSSTQYGEAFVINVLEHALSRDPSLLPPDGQADGVSRDVKAWREALRPLRDAVNQRRVWLSDAEGRSLSIFQEHLLSFMRNWPVKYRELQQNRDTDARRGGIQVSELGTGILGGQSLAIAAASPRADVAREFILFMTGLEAQQVLALHGLAPVRTNVYGGATSGPVSVLEATIPHLRRISEAVAHARPRPIHRNYRQFADALHGHARALLAEGRDLPQSFETQIDDAFA